eukprot:757344-Hanusia_phi.AAC.2
MRHPQKNKNKKKKKNMGKNKNTNMGKNMGMGMGNRNIRHPPPTPLNVRHQSSSSCQLRIIILTFRHAVLRILPLSSRASGPGRLLEGASEEWEGGRGEGEAEFMVVGGGGGLEEEEKDAEGEEEEEVVVARAHEQREIVLLQPFLRHVRSEHAALPPILSKPLPPKTLRSLTVPRLLSARPSSFCDRNMRRRRQGQAKEEEEQRSKEQC